MADIPLPPDACKAQIRIDPGLPPLAKGQVVFHRVRVKNVSSQVWSAHGKHGLSLSYHWHDRQGNRVVWDGARTPLPPVLPPGQEVVLDCRIEVPDTVGVHDLEFDVVEEDVAWFKNRGSATARTRCDVGAAAPTYKLRFTGQCSAEQFQATCAAQGWWYHSYYFDNGCGVAGDYDIGRNIHEYGFPDDMTGMSVLDIGTGSGWFAHYFEQRGARVTATDIRGRCDYDAQGRFTYPPIAAEKPAPDLVSHDGRPLYFSRVSRGFWIMRELLGSKAVYYNARAYEVCPELFGGREFDLVFIGALLLHLHDPIGALMAARSVCTGRLFATTHILEHDYDDRPRMEAVSSLTSEWWFPNKAGYRRWFLDAGFRRVDVDRAVTLTADQIAPSFEVPGTVRNGTHRLQLAEAHV